MIRAVGLVGTARDDGKIRDVGTVRVVGNAGTLGTVRAEAIL